jgi:hypothetical protein
MRDLRPDELNHVYGGNKGQSSRKQNRTSKHQVSRTDKHRASRTDKGKRSA